MATTASNGKNGTDESPPNWRRESHRSWHHTGDDYLAVEVHHVDPGLSAEEFNRGKRVDGGRYAVYVRDQSPPSSPETIWEGNAQSAERPQEEALAWMREHPEGV